MKSVLQTKDSFNWEERHPLLQIWSRGKYVVDYQESRRGASVFMCVLQTAAKLPGPSTPTTWQWQKWGAPLGPADMNRSNPGSAPIQLFPFLKCQEEDDGETARMHGGKHMDVLQRASTKLLLERKWTHKQECLSGMWFVLRNKSILCKCKPFLTLF